MRLLIMKKCILDNSAIHFDVFRLFCGIAALSMACLLSPTPPTIEFIMNEAKTKGFTNNGEMFSADNMKLLAESVLSPWYHVDLLTSGLEINQEGVIKGLINGDVMLIPYPSIYLRHKREKTHLVNQGEFAKSLKCERSHVLPALTRNSYDADKNHSPVCLRGHKAHWALVCGALRSQDGTWHVAARQGKSRRLHVWRYNDLALSNANLAELDPVREADGLTYVLPPEGIKRGLASKFVMLKRR